MACNKNKNKQWQNINFVRTLATSLSQKSKADVTIYKTYERGLGEVYCFDIFKSGNEPSTTVEIIRFQQPESSTLLSNDEVAGLQDANSSKTIKTQQTTITKSKKSGKPRK